MATLKGMLLDIDGTLLLSSHAHAQAWEDAFREFDFDIPAQRVEPLIGMGGDKLLSKLVPGLSDQEGRGKELTERRKQIFLEQYAPRLEPAPGTRALLERLCGDGLHLTIATSAKDDELKTLLERAGIEDLIGETTTSDDAEESKPDPDIIAAALEKSGLSADEVLMLGDTPYDVEAAARCRVGVIAVRCGGHDRDLAGAMAIYDDPADLLAHYDDSPIGRRLGETPQ